MENGNWICEKLPEESGVLLGAPALGGTLTHSACSGEATDFVSLLATTLPELGLISVCSNYSDHRGNYTLSSIFTRLKTSHRVRGTTGNEVCRSMTKPEEEIVMLRTISSFKSFISDWQTLTSGETDPM
jgi:hypothetical protein